MFDVYDYIQTQSNIIQTIPEEGLVVGQYALPTYVQKNPQEPFLKMKKGDIIKEPVHSIVIGQVFGSMSIGLTAVKNSECHLLL